jgi:hypothetical protein
MAIIIKSAAHDYRAAETKLACRRNSRPSIMAAAEAYGSGTCPHI